MRTLSFLGLDAAERPRLNATSIRQLARLGTVVRWPGLLFAAILALAVPPKSPVGLALVLVWVTVYNAWGMIAISKADDGSILRVGRALTLLDTVSYFLVLFVFGGVGASTSIYAAYILLIVWMVAYDGAEGAMLVVGIFVVGMIALHTALKAVFNQEFAVQDVVQNPILVAVDIDVTIAIASECVPITFVPQDRSSLFEKLRIFMLEHVLVRLDVGCLVPDGLVEQMAGCLLRCSSGVGADALALHPHGSALLSVHPKVPAGGDQSVIAACACSVEETTDGIGCAHAGDVGKENEPG